MMTTRLYQPHTKRLERVDAFVRELFHESLPKDLLYHCEGHTLDPQLGVVSVADYLAQLEGLNTLERELVVTAAYLHDTRYVKQYQKNEPIGAAIAGEALPELGYRRREIKTVRALILVTDITTTPKNLLEKIIRDADVDNLGRDDFFEKNELLRRELRIDNVEQWYTSTIKFMEQHQFYTRSAQICRNEIERRNLEDVRKRLYLLQHPELAAVQL